MAKKETHEKVRIERLPCQLTPDEVRARGEKAAMLYAERDEVEQDYERAKEIRKERIGSIDSRISQHMQEVRTRQEHRDVRVVDRENFDDKHNPQVETVRLDTGELVRSRPMTDLERQGKLLPLDGGAEANA